MSDTEFDEKTVTDIEGWTVYENSVEVPANKKFSVYVKVQDNAGNITYTNSAGVVIYKDSVADTNKIEYTRTTMKDVSANVNFNENTIKSVINVTNNNEVLSGEAYKVDYTAGTITFAGAYLDTLPATTYAIKISYNPLGETYVDKENNEAASDTAIELVVKKHAGYVSVSAADVDYNEKAYNVSSDSLTITTSGTGAQTVAYKRQGEDDNKYTTEAPTNAGDYVVRVTVAADNYYEAACATDEFKIKKVQWRSPSGAAFKETIKGKADGKWTIIYDSDATDAEKNAKLEYKLRYEDVSKYKDVSGTSIENLAAGDYDVRRKGDDNHEPSIVTPVTIDPGPYLTVSMPAVTTGYEVSCEALSANDYKVEWHEGYSFAINVDKKEYHRGANYKVLVNSVEIQETEGVYVVSGASVTTNQSITVEGVVPHTWIYVTSEAATATQASISAVCSLEGCGATAGSVTITAPTGELVYAPGKAKEATLSGAFYTGLDVNTLVISYEKYDETNKKYVSMGDNKPVDAGNYRASITVGGTTASVKYTIAKAEMVFDKVNDITPYTGTYDTVSHAAIVSVITPEDATIEYSTATDGAIETKTYSSDMPQFKDAGSYAVYYKLSKENYNDIYGSVTVKISPDKVTKPSEDRSAHYYTGEVLTYNITPSALYTISGNKQKEVSTYAVTVRLNDKDNYVWSDNTTADLTYEFVIKYFTPATGDVIEITGAKKNESVWYTGDVTITAPTGYAISVSGSAYASSYAVTEDCKEKEFKYTLKKTDGGYITSQMAVSISKDATAPEVDDIEIKTNSIKNFFNKLTFGLFFKSTKDVTITTSDKEDGVASGVAKTYYYLSSAALTLDEVSGDAIVWKEYTDKFSINPKNKHFVYVKVVDNAGNVSYMDSKGIVLYTDSVANTQKITYTKTSTENVPATVTLNGNTVKSVSCGGVILTPGSCYVTDEAGTITFTAAYLDTLKAGDYELVVSYNPLGEKYVENVAAENEAPDTTTINLTVVKAKGEVAITSAKDKVYDTKPYGSKEGEFSYTVTGTGVVTVEYKEATQAAAYSETTPAAAGTYNVRVTMAENDFYTSASAEATFVIKNKEQDAPVVEGIPETIKGKGDGHISGVAVGTMEYSTDDKNYIVVTNAAMDLAVGKYYVRYAAKPNYNSSSSTAVEIASGPYLTVSMPAVTTGYSVSCEALSAQAFKVEWHEGYSFAINVDEEKYHRGATYKVLVNDKEIQETDGVYVVSDASVTTNQSITVEGVEKHDWIYVTSEAATEASLTAKCSYCSKEAGTVTITAPERPVYDGTAKEATLSGVFTNGTATPEITYASVDSTGATTPIDAAPVKAGTYQASITVGGTTATVQYTIDKASLDKYVTVESYNRAYDCSGHSISVTVDAAAPTSNDAVKIQYSTDAAVINSDLNPSFTEVGEYPVYYKVSKENYYDLTGSSVVVITPQPVPEPVKQQNMFFYSDKEYTYTIAEDPKYTIAGNLTQKDVGKYSATISLNDKHNYIWESSKKNDDLTYDFEIVYAQFVDAVLDGDKGSDNWFKGEVTIKPPVSGYAISTDGTNWNNTLTVSGEGTNTYNYCLKNEAGHVSTQMAVEIKIDNTPPEITDISFKESSINAFLNKVTFGLFFKETLDVTITTIDKIITTSEDASGIDKVYYYIASKELDDNALKALQEKDWKAYYANDLTISPNSKCYVYVKAVDNAGNVSYAHSDGVVLYTDSEADTKSIEYTKTTKADVEATVRLNGNTVKSVSCEGVVLTPDAAYVTGDAGIITFVGTYLDTLSAGEHQLEISYNPLGEKYVEDNVNQAPETTTITLTVKKAQGSVKIADLPSRAYIENVPYEVTNYAVSADSVATVEYKKVTDSEYVTKAPVDAGEYIVRVTAPSDDNYEEASATANFEITKADKAAPVVTPVAVTISGKQDGHIEGLAVGMEYSTEADGPYKAVKADTVNMEFPVGTYYVRYAETANYKASKTTTVEIKEGRELQVTLPATQTGYTITSNKSSLKYNGEYVLTLSIKDGYHTDNLVVKANDTVLIENNGVYSVENITTDQAITVSGVEAHEWTCVNDGKDTIKAVCSGSSECSEEAGSVTIVAPKALVYTGEAKEATVEGAFTVNKEISAISYAQKNSAGEFVAITGKPVNAGTYQASITVDGVKAVVEYTIEKAKGSVVIAPQQPKTFDNTAYEVTGYAVSGNGVVTLEYKEKAADDSSYVTGAPVNAGTYTVRVTAAEGDNYKAASATADFEITRAENTAPAVTARAETIFGKKDGTIEGLTTEMEYSTEENGKYKAVEDAGMTFEAGTYYVRYAQTNNLNASAAAKVEIAKGAMLKVTLPQTQTGYTITASETELEYLGDYVLTLSVNDGYHTDNLEVKVNDKVVTGKNGVYTINNIEADQVITVSGVKAHEWTYENDGKDTIKAVCSGKECKAEAGSVTIVAPKTPVYTGEAKAATVEGSFTNQQTVPAVAYAKKGDDGSYAAIDGAPVNAGDYQASITVGSVKAVVEFTIAKAVITDVNAADYTATYNKEAHVIEVTSAGADVTYSTDGAVYTSEKPSFTDAGTYTVYYKVSKDDYEDYTGTLQVVINKAKVEIPKADDTVYYYTGAEQTYKIAESDLYTVSNTSRTDAGTQMVKVNLVDSSNYTWSDNGISEQKYEFTIGYYKADCEAVISGTAGAENWYTSDVAVKAPEGYQISVNGKDWSDSFAVEDGMKEYGYYLKNSEGYITDEMKVTVGKDTVLPVVDDIKTTTNSIKKLLNDITFGHFFKNTQDVTITAGDAESGIDKVYYYVTSEAVTAGALNEDIPWTEGSKLTLGENTKSYVCVKAVDKAGNVNYAYSDGVVIYTDSEQDTETIEHVRLTKDDAKASVKLNGNTVKSITYEETVLEAGKDYEISENGEITFKADYLNTFTGGTYTFRVSYNPAGEEYVDAYGNEAPKSTVITLKIKVIGDIDNNQNVSLDDANRALRIVLGIEKVDEETLKLLDVDNDGDVDLIDVKLILHLALGISVNI